MQTTIVLPKPVGRAMRAMAKEQRRSLSNLMSEVCRDFLNVTSPGWNR